VIVGLGNPGRKYSETRHNVGFKVVQNLANKINAKFEEKEPEYLVAGGKIDSTPFYLLLPLTYMNLSGKAIKKFRLENDFELNDMLVVCDDINLDLGRIRLRAKGSHGGHNGLHSIIEEIQSVDFPRLRIGIGSNFEKGEQAEYVLSPFEKDELPTISEAIEKSTKICEVFLVGGLKEALEYYSKLQAEEKSNPTNKGVTK
jgi:PTH1 family peptidyl-tRNA hydrolase